MTRQDRVRHTVRLPREALSEPYSPSVQRIAGTPLADTAPAGRGLALPSPGRPFHYTARLTKLCRDIVARTPELAHIDISRVLVTFVRSRNRRQWGLQAKLVPLRFEGGARYTRRRGYWYRVQRLMVDRREILYVLSFYLPRFQDQSFSEKMVTLFHELYHIGPDFVGDIRRPGQGQRVHDPNRQAYDRHMAELARRYLKQRPEAGLFDFLRLSFDQLHARYGEVVGVTIPAPKLIPVQRSAKR